jgi:hypothetical protein
MSFKKLIILNIDGVSVPEIKYDNFTTVPPNICNIQSHNLEMVSNAS